MRTTARGSIVHFWQQLPFATKRGRFLELPPGCFFLGCELEGSSILIRKSYEDLLGIVMGWMTTGNRKMVIAGSPGIGKLYFLFYLMHHLATSSPSPPVVVLQMWNRPVLCFTGNTVLEGTLDSFRMQLHSTSTWYLVDGVEPMVYEAKTVLVTAADRSVFWRFLKEVGCTLRYMPPWSVEELEACRARRYPHLEAGLFRKLYRKWGGRPRYVLEKALDTSPDALLAMTLGRTLGICNYLDMIDTFWVFGPEGKPGDSLLEIRILDDYITPDLAFASEHFEEMVVASLLRNREDEVRAWLDSYETHERMARGVQRSLFKGLARKTLLEGGRFTCRELIPGCGSSEAGAFGTLTLPHQDKAFTASDLCQVRKAASGDYCVPSPEVMPAVDALIKPNIVFQMAAAGLNHAVDLAGLNHAISALSLAEEDEVQLYFVVPPGLFANGTFQAQTLVPPTDSPSMRPACRVRQYALKLKLIMDD